MSKAEQRIACPRCQSGISQDSYFCWKCGSRLKTEGFESKGIELDYESDPVSGGSGFNFNLASLMLLVTLIAICLALFVAAPGLGIFLAILSIIPFVRTILVISRRRSTGQSVSGVSKALLFLGSVGVTTVITVTTLFSAALAFFFSCLGASALMEPARPGPDFGVRFPPLWITLGFTLTVIGLVLWAFSSWIRYRWRRDTQPQTIANETAEKQNR